VNAGTPTVLTIGHSTRPIEDFLELLRAHGVTVLADVRIAPGSRRHPQFDKAALAEALAAAGIGYRHLPDLGGRRLPRPDSANAGWRNEGFRGYADYMQTPEFAAALQALIGLIDTDRVVLMCAEAVPWRCHRSLIADALVARGGAVEHIIGPGRRSPHALTAWARVEGGRVTYPAPAERQLGLDL